MNPAAWLVLSPAGSALSAGPASASPEAAHGAAMADIVPDKDFARRIPAMPQADDEEPLESLEDFERRIAESLERENGPDDPAIAASLEPLDSFAGQPLLSLGPDAEADTAEIAYDWAIEGLDLADSQTRASLKGLFDELSALRKGRGKAESRAQVLARLREDALLLERLLASQGWFEAQVSTRLRPAGEGRPLAALLEVEPGLRYVLGETRIAAAETEPPGLIAQALALERGQPIVADRIVAAEARVALVLPRRGYPFAAVGERDIELDPDSGEGVLTLPVDTGPRAVFGAIRSTGRQAFDASHIATIARFRQGEPYDAAKVDDLRQALIATGLFATLSVAPVRSGEAASEGLARADIAVEQQAGPPRTIAASAGYGTGQGLRAEASWTHRNLFPPEGALIASIAAGTKEQSLSASFRRANAGQRDRVFQTTAEVLRRDFAAYQALTGRVAALMSRDSTPLWQKRLTWAAGVQLLATDEEIFDTRRSAERRRTYLVGGLTGQLGFDRSDSLLDPTRGFRLTALVEPEGSLQGGFTPYVRARLDASAYVQPADSLVLAGRARLGTIQGIARNELAPSRRFYAGGGGSVRGFGYQAIGPRVEVANPAFDPADPDEKARPFLYRAIGARSLAEAAVELRYRFGDYGVVAFVDAGQAWESSTPRFTNWRFGAGLGGRIHTDFGPLRVDLATPLNPRRGDGWLTVLVSIGQAF
ncbi:MAG TPA: BamA/TamA family outer membrane protein [Novosphingobium sp.]|nr:BamA/TamA family outer membrane protein [Novosphingobium sp.]